MARDADRLGRLLTRSPRTTTLRDLGVALSLANFCFFRVWSRLLEGSPTEYYLKDPPARADFAAVMGNVLLLALVFWTGATLARRWALLRSVAVASLLLVCLLVLNDFRRHTPGLRIDEMLDRFGPTAVAVLLIGVVGMAAVAAVLWHRAIARAAAIVLLTLAPFAALTFGRALWSLSRSDAPARFANRVAAPAQARPADRRVLWLVFDELDQRVTFPNRPAHVRLPNLDRLRGESVYATHAYPPSRHTVTSLPALVIGRAVRAAEPVGPGELRLRLAGEPTPVTWSTQTTVFTQARTLGVDTAIVGWLHPYCRVLGHHVNRCAWYAEPEFARERGGVAGVVRGLVQPLQEVAAAIPASWLLRVPAAPFHPRPERRSHVALYRSVREDALTVLRDRTLGLVMIHWPVPHPPGIYDPVRNRVAEDVDGTYFDNLVLVDRTLGEIREALERDGLWTNTTVLVTSDHAWRESRDWDGRFDDRVPFVLRLAGQTTGAVYDRTFNTTLSHDLVLALLRGDLRDAGGVAEWLDTNRGRFRSVPFGRAGGRADLG